MELILLYIYLAGVAISMVVLTITLACDMRSGQVITRRELAALIGTGFFISCFSWITLTGVFYIYTHEFFSDVKERIAVGWNRWWDQPVCGGKND